MVTRTGPNTLSASLLEITVQWADDAPPVVARLDRRHARQLIARLAFADPDALESAVADAASEPVRLLLGVQAYCRHLLDHGGRLALTDREGDLWLIPVRSARAIGVRLVSVSTAEDSSTAAVELRSAFCSPSSEASRPC